MSGTIGQTTYAWRASATVSSMERLPTSHNSFFHFALSHLPSTRSLIEGQFDPRAVPALNLDTLRRETGSFVNTDLRERFSDLLLSVDLAGCLGKSPKSAYVYFLFEHKSQTDPLAVFQLLLSMLRIWEKRLQAGLELCPRRHTASSASREMRRRREHQPSDERSSGVTYINHPLGSMFDSSIFLQRPVQVCLSWTRKPTSKIV